MATQLSNEISNGKIYKIPTYSTIKEDIVISGISGMFPNSADMKEFMDNLYNGVNCVVGTKRFAPGYHGLPPLIGNIPTDLDEFDSEFFGLDDNSVDQMGYDIRILCEKIYEAIIDSGTDPQTLRGTKTGFFLSHAHHLDENTSSLLPAISWISSVFDFRGPFSSVDSMCATSFQALNDALIAMRTGDCDAAIVAASDISLSPGLALMYANLDLYAPDSKCKSFDESCDGFANSEAIVAIFLQKKSDAKRVYLTAITVKTSNDGYKREGIMFPKWKTQSMLMSETYKEVDINPIDVLYIEGHITATKVGDIQECRSIGDALCKRVKRKEPLLVSAVKSNIGHTQLASGLSAVAKAIISSENRLIPPNINLNKLNPKIPELFDGTIKPVMEPTEFEGGLIGFNNFGLGGSNAHVVLHSNKIDISVSRHNIFQYHIPRLVLMCGRTHQAIDHIFNYIESNKSTKITHEFLCLLNKVSRQKNMPFRGSMILKSNAIEHSSKIVIEKSGQKPIKLWYVFPGLDCQYPAMASSLMSIDTFAQVIHRLSEVLKPFDIDLIELLTSDDMSLLNKSIVNKMVSLTAFQIAVINLFSHLGFKPDGLIGYSNGEISCAFADGVLNEEQAILVTYWRAKLSEINVKDNGLMVAVNLSEDEINKIIPNDIYIGAIDSGNSVTISGPHENTKKFVENLKSNNIETHEVNTCGIAFNSPILESVRESLSSKLNSLNILPKMRTTKWITTSSESDNSLADVDYYVNNLINPVNFNRATNKIPENSVIIEISPQQLFKDKFLDKFGSDCKYVNVINRNEKLEDFLQTIAKLYQFGLNPAIENLYPKCEYPVPKGTAFISPLMRWDHSRNWQVADLTPELLKIEKSKQPWLISPDDQKYEVVYDHVIEDKCIFPATGYLVLVWKTIANILQIDYNQLPVQFDDVKFLNMTHLSRDKNVVLEVHYFQTSGRFSIRESDNVCVTGRISVVEDPVLKFDWIKNEMLENVAKEPKMMLDSIGFYKLARLHGYDFGPLFKGLVDVSFDGKYSRVKWTKSWISFLDSMLQIGIMRLSSDEMVVPTFLDTIRIDPRVIKNIGEMHDNNLVNVVFDAQTQIIVSDCMEVIGLNGKSIQRKTQKNVTLDKHIFVPLDDQCVVNEIMKKNMIQYINACNALANGSKPIDLDNYLNDNSDNYQMIKILDRNFNKELNDEDSQKVFDSVHENGKYMTSSDFLLNCCFKSEILLKPIIDLVIENTFNEKLEILEINSGGESLEKHIKQIMNFNNFAHNYTIKQLEEKVIKSQIQDQGNTQSIENKDLVIYRDDSASKFGQSITNVKKQIKLLYSSMNEKEFLLIVLRVNHFEFEETILRKRIDHQIRYEQFLTEAENMGLTLICQKYDSISISSMLFRKMSKISTENLNRFIVNVTNENYLWLEELKNYYSKLEFKDQIWLLSNEKNTGLLGMFACLRKEPYGQQLRCIITDQKLDQNGTYLIPQEVLQRDLQQNLHRNGKWGQMIHLPIDEEVNKLIETEYGFVKNQTIGEINSLTWFESPNKYWPLIRTNENEIFVNVFYSAINFKDIMVASGQLEDKFLENCLCAEFSGIDSNGNRLMGISFGSLATNLILDVNLNPFVWSVPHSMTLEEAATIPVAYSTCYYALFVRGKLKNNESVLIHLGSGGVGYAAIRICLSMNCHIFTTVGSLEKKDFLIKEFPQLNENHILNSRDTKFESEIMKLTNGYGVDLVLNSLSGDKLLASAKCLARNGRFCDISRFDMAINNKFDLNLIGNNQVYESIVLEDRKNVLQKILNNGIESGVVKPIPCTVFDKENIVNAFRYMASAKHKGKVLIKVRDENQLNSKVLKVMANHQTFFNPHKSYIIVGGLGGFGLELTQWMAERGAKKIVITSRTGAKESYQFLILKKLENSGINVKIWIGSSTQEQEMADTFKCAEELGPIGGIFHLAMVLKDTPIVNMTQKMFGLAADTKFKVCQHLDQLSRQLCPHLDYFVVFSSYSSGFGNAAQSNYGFGNSVCERICEARREDGLHAIAIQWGAIGDAGVFTETLQKRNFGISVQRMRSALQTLDKLLNTKHAIVGSYILRAHNRNVKNDFLSQVSRIMGINNLSTLDPKTKLVDLGLDSLMNIEIRFLLERNFAINYKPKRIGNLTLNDLNAIQSGSLKPNVTELLNDSRSLAIDTIGQMKISELEKEPISFLNDRKTGKPVIFLPPGDADYKRLSKITQRMSCPAIALNLTHQSINCQSIELLAQDYIKVLDDSGINIEEYSFVGASFGTLIALELSIQLQSLGRKVKNLLLLDGSPEFFFNLNQEFDIKDKNFVARIIIEFCMIKTNAGMESIDILDRVLDCDSEEEMFHLAHQYLTANDIHSDINDLSSRLRLQILVVRSLFNCKPDLTSKFDGDVILIKPITQLIGVSIKHEHDYGLSKIITGKCDVYTVNGNHFTFVDEGSHIIADLINKFQ